jgi:hypothetical protein
LTEQETISLGEYSQDLLNQDNFNTLVKLFEQQVSHDFLQTKPEEKQKREGIYASYVGFAEFLGLMTALVKAKDALLKANELELPEDEGALPQEID